MKNNTRVGARKLGMAATTALAVVGLGVAGSAAAAGPAAAVTPSGSASVANNTLTISGGNGPDNISIFVAGGDPNTLHVNYGAQGPAEQTFDRGTFNTIAVFLGDGNDQFTEDVSVPTEEALTVDAGSGNDTITTGNGNDLIFAGSGNDTVTSGAGDDIIDAGSGDDNVNGGLGHDTAFLGSGQDTFVWNNGDGSDFVDGGDGNNDALTFNGASGDEQMTLSANGHRAVFLRNLGNIRMDLDGIEQVNANPLGGADTVTVNDLTGTDVRQANVDLGPADSKVDTVIVNGTEQADRMQIDANKGSVDAKGLKTETRITDSEPTDQLQVNALGGFDKVSIDAAALPLIGVGVDLGTGQL